MTAPQETQNIWPKPSPMPCPTSHAVQSGPWTARKPSWSIWVSGRTRAPAPTVCGLFSPHWQASRSFSSAPPALVRIRRIFLRSSAALRVNSPELHRDWLVHVSWAHGRGVRRRYEAMLQDPVSAGQAELLLKNFDAVRTRPDERDAQALLAAAGL